MPRPFGRATSASGGKCQQALVDEHLIIRDLLLDPFVANQLDQNLIQYLFLTSEGREQVVHGPHQKPLPLYQLIINGFGQMNDPNSLTLPNGDRKLTLILPQKFLENTQKIIDCIYEVYKLHVAVSITSLSTYKEAEIGYTLIEQLALFGCFKSHEKEVRQKHNLSMQNFT
jgi:hypothetical protein